MTEEEKDRRFNIHMAHEGPSAALTVRATHHYGLPWEKTAQLANLLGMREMHWAKFLPEYMLEAIDAADQACSFAVRRCGSPIEQLFLATLCTQFPFTDRAKHLWNTQVIETLEARVFAWVEYIDDGTTKDLAVVYQQFPIGKYRADFAIEGPTGRAIVECDGHDFHERTKQQAARDKARDRAIVEAGWPVLRFTGSELWNDPTECAQQALRVVGA